MFSKKNSYVINTQNLTESDLGIVGREALALSKLHVAQVPSVESIVITANAFDDFINAGNLIDPILSELEKVQPFVRESAEIASENISKLILNTELPSIIKRPIQEAYKELLKNKLPFVKVMRSNIIENEFVPNKEVHYKEIKTFEDVLENLKLAWMNLFTADALEYRANGYFKGTLTIGVILQKQINFEISGYIISQSDSKEIEIGSIYGLSNEEIYSYDLYKYDLESNSLVEKVIVPQKEMLIRLPKSNMSFKKIEITEDWQSKPKIHESFLEKIYKYAEKIRTEYGKDIKIDWGIHAGNIYFEKVSKIKILPDPNQTSDMSDEIAIKNLELEINSEDNSMKAESEFFGDERSEEQSTEASKAPISMDDIVEEVQNNALDMTEEDEESATSHTKNIVKKKITKSQNAETNDENKDSLDWLSRKKLVTEIFVDCSSMSSSRISKIEYFNGAFIDGTNLILNNGVLPEESSEDKLELQKIVESLTLDISAVSKFAESKKVIYQFSNITDLERKLLGIKNSKYEYDGDERFIENPTALAVEASAVRKVRNNLNHKNLSICLPAIRTYDNFRDIKKILTSQNLRRSNSMEIYLEVSMPSLLFELDEIKDSFVDGIIINYELLMKLSLYRNQNRKKDSKLGIKKLKHVFKVLKDKKIKSYIRLNQNPDEVIDNLNDLQPTGLIFEKLPDLKVIEKIEEIESSNFQKMVVESRRGRKEKSLF